MEKDCIHPLLTVSHRIQISDFAHTVLLIFKQQNHELKKHKKM
jgi:hypothetical protein